MNLKFIRTDFIASVKSWTRSPGTVFWTILFPILLIMIFGAIFSEGTDVKYDLIVQNMDVDDETNFTKDFINNLKKIDILKLDEVGENKDIKKYMLDEDKPAALIIPEDFGLKASDYINHKIKNPDIPYTNYSLPINLTIVIDPSDQSYVALQTIINGVIGDTNLGLNMGEKVIGHKEKSSLGEDFEFIDFFVPGMIGFTIMTSMIYGSIERNTKYRKDGILRKLLTMPITRAEWIFSKMLFMLFLSFISTLVILAVGILVWGLTIKVNIFLPVLIISTSFMFSGLGMIIGRFVKEEETADMAGGAITFPMMFLAGTFFPLDQMPEFLQTIAQFLPLYYVNEALRYSMIHADLEKTLFFTAFVFVFALVFFIIGVFLTKWKED